MTYDIIYMDPPWAYNNKYLHAPGVTSTIEEKHYPTMSIDELKAMDIKGLTNDDSLIYMWVTSPFMEMGLEIGRHWGFEFSTVAFVWDKQLQMPGYYTLGQTEYVLLFKKKGGKIPQPRGARNVRQFLSEKRTIHSKKPHEIRRRIELLHPTQTKLEMFARETREGWDVFGNETTKFNNEV